MGRNVAGVAGRFAVQLECAAGHEVDDHVRAPKLDHELQTVSDKKYAAHVLAQHYYLLYCYALISIGHVNSFNKQIFFGI